jgi:hypothetical protein
MTGIKRKNNEMNIKLIFLLYFLFMLGCQTPGYFIMDHPQQLSEIRKAVNVVMGKTKLVSLNGRELYSNYHDEKFEPIEEDLVIIEEPFYRYQTKVMVLGPRRPYEINVQVIVEQFEAETKKFLPVGIEDDLSRQRAISLKKALNLSPGIKAGFDEEKPF